MSSPIFDELLVTWRTRLIFSTDDLTEIEVALNWSPLPDDPPMIECRNWALETIRTAHELWYRP